VKQIRLEKNEDGTYRVIVKVDYWGTRKQLASCAPKCDVPKLIHDENEREDRQLNLPVGS
jgi:hypothetical protein